jgi:hypothetical protein
VLISYFLICGGFTLTLLAVLVIRVDSTVVACAAYGIGAVLGGFLAGRASAERSLLEPALAALLVIASAFAWVYFTPLGRLVLSMDRAQWPKMSIILGGVGCGGALIGAGLGELTAGDRHVVSTPGWVVNAAVVTLGALFLAGTAASCLLAGSSAVGPIARYLHADLRQLILSEEDRVVAGLAGALASSAFVGGLVSQVAAPRRQLLACAVGAFGAVAGLGLVLARVAQQLRQLLVAAVAVGGAAAAIALVGAVFGWFVIARSGRARA